MARYLLQQPWTLRGFLNAPYVLIDPSGSIEHPVRPLNETLFSALLTCDGQTDCAEGTAQRVLQKHGLIAPVLEENAGLSPEQTYRLNRFDLKPAVQLSITGRCNLNCLHCFMAAEKERGRPDDDLTREQLLRLVDQFPACGVDQVELTGGEPLICPHFRAVAERLALRHVTLVRILTNGLAVDGALFDFLAAQGQRPEMVISFDGLGTHDWLRNSPHAEEAALAAMRLTVARGFPLRCTVQVNRRSLPRLIETCRYLVRLGAKSLYVIRTTETPRWAENAWVSESLPVPAYYEACCELAQAVVREQWNIRLDVFNGFSLYFDPTPKLVRSSPCDDGASCLCRCGRAASTFFIEHTGRVLLCDAFEGIGGAGGLLDGANLKETPLAEMLRGSAYAEIGSVTLGDIKKANKACRDCSYFGECGGGCRAVGYGSSMFHEAGYVSAHGRLDKRAFTTCTYYRGGYAARMRALTE